MQRLQRKLENACRIENGKGRAHRDRRIVFFGAQQLATFDGKGAATQAGIYRRTLVDSIWKLVGTDEA